MANELDPVNLGTWIGGAVTALITSVVGINAYLSRKRVGDAADTSTIIGFKGNDQLLKNLQDELKRLSEKVNEMDTKIDHLTDKLANVRLVALDCYQLATDCGCDDENRTALLNHLRTIIKEA